MKTKNLKVLLLALIGFSFFACSDDDNKDNGGKGEEQKEIKALVACEGNIGEANATLDLIFNDNSIERNAFERRNRRPIGDVAHSITEIDDKLFLTLNNSAKIEVVNKEDLKQIATIDNASLEKPIYISKISDNKAVVSHIEKSHITIIDTKEYKILSTVPTADRVKQMITVADRLFVAEDEAIEVFSIKNGELTLLETLKHPVTSNSRLIQTADNNIWALCCAYENGGKDYSTIRPEKENNAYLICINPATLKEVKRIPLQNLYPQKYSAKLEVNNNGTELYIPLWKNYKFIPVESGDFKYMNIEGELGLYKVATKDQTISTTPLFKISDKATTFYNLVISPTNTIYICDALDYKQDGYIYEYTDKGEKVNEYKMGISPQAILFY